MLQDISSGGAASVEVEVGGAGRRLATLEGPTAIIIDPAANTVLDRAPLGIQGNTVDIAPTLTELCVIWGYAQKKSIGRYDLAAHRWVFRYALADGGGYPVIATRDRCIARVPRPGGGPARLVAYSSTTKEPTELDAPELDIRSTRRVVWTADRALRFSMFLAQPQAAPEGPWGWTVDVRDGDTLARRGPPFWANCVRPAEHTAAVGLHAIENDARRAYLLGALAFTPIECSPPARPQDSQLPWVLPSFWVVLADERLMRHDDSGLVIWDWRHHRHPTPVPGAPPVAAYKDVNQRNHPLAPVGAADGSWIGVIDATGVLQRWDARTLGPLSAVRLPTAADGESPAQAQWQVFSGPGGRLAVTRDAKDSSSRRALYLGHLAGQKWTRSDARVFWGIAQAVKWVGPAEGGRWLLADPHYGLTLVDADTARAAARFDKPAAQLSRFGGVTLAPDGARVAVGVDDWEGRDDGGIYILDARTLTVVGRPVTNGAKVPRDVLDWTPGGLIAASRTPIFTGPTRMRLDPVTGAIAELPMGVLRHYRGDSVFGTIRTAYGLNDRVVVTSPLDASEELILGVVDGKGFVQYADGQVWCEGAACTAFRCVTAAGTRALVDNPATAGKTDPAFRNACR